jgi:pyrrolysine biosynthesis protein PylD
MTRLTSDQVTPVPDSLPVIDAHLRRVTGVGLSEIAARTTRPRWSLGLAGGEAADFGSLVVGVVPVTAGQGCIPGFVEAVAAVCRFVGSEVFVTPQTDIAGIAFAAERGARVVMAADDECFVALDAHKGGCVDNGVATGEAFAAVLAAASGDLAGRRVLVVGLGRVGMAAAAWMCEAGAVVMVVERDRARAEVAARSLPVVVVDSVEDGLVACDLVLHAAPEGGLIDIAWVTPCSYVAAPGIPLGVTEAAREALGDHLVHEPLALGVATMLAKVLSGSARSLARRWTGGTASV